MRNPYIARLSLPALLLAAVTVTLPARAADDVIPHAQDKPPGPALSPAEAMAKMELHEGFAVELFAAEPDVINPTAMTFDERGRIWVCESFEYPRREPGPGKDRVKILEDTDGDGACDKVTVFKEGLNIPCGIAHGNGGVYITNAPDILFLKDTDGDDVADTEEVIVTGFGRDDTHELPNNLIWGPDGWLYGMNGVFNASRVKDPATGTEYEFTCAIWRYHPPTKRFELFAEGTSNPWGLDYNRQGDWFLSCCVIDHMFHMTQSGYYIRQGGPYPPMTVPLGSITTEHHQKAAYAGLVIYDADAYPEQYQEKLFMGNLHGSCINTDVLERNGSTYRQSNDPDFLSANDAWFMPVAQKLGPDGCVYVMDWYDRYHCYQDANRDSPGLDRGKGRIYRISYKDTPRAKPFDLAKLGNEELLKLLGHSNVWWRRQAQRLLNERFDESLVPALQEMALDGGDETQAHMHALWLLVSQGQLDPEFHLKVLNSDNASMRNWGVRAVGQMGEVSEAVYQRLIELAADESPDVRVQVAVAAGRLREPDALPVLQAMLQNPANAEDPLIPTIIYNNLKPLAPSRGRAVLAFLDKNPQIQESFGQTVVPWIREAVNATGLSPQEIVAQLTKVLFEKQGEERVGQALQTVIDSLSEVGIKPEERAGLFDEPARKAVGSLAADAQSEKVRIAATKIALWWDDRRALESARAVVGDENAEPGARAEMLRALAQRNDPANFEAFKAYATDAEAPLRLRKEAIDALGSMGDREAAGVLTGAYGDLPVDLKPAALNALTRTQSGAAALLTALESEQIPLADVTANHVRQVHELGQEELSGQFTAVWGAVKTERDPERVKVVEAMRKVVRQTKGDPVAGKAVFTKACAQCHTIYGEGGNVGPDITGVGRETLDAVLTNVLDPNLVIGKPYFAWAARLKNGEVFTGLLIEESDKRVVLKNQTETRILPRDEIDRLKMQDLSMMPEGLEKTMSEQEFCDLVAFLLTTEPPAGTERREGQPPADAGVQGAAEEADDAGEAEGGEAKVREVSLEEFDEMRDDEGVVVLDVRTADEYADGHVPGAVNVDAMAEDFEDRAEELDKFATYLVHCASGRRSARAVEKMRELGFTSLFNFSGGMRQWREAGKDVEQ